jgi:hypothetical protein
MSPPSPVQAMESAVRAVDSIPSVLRVNNLDVVSLVAHASTSTGADLLKWLSWERISEETFLWAMRLGQNLAQPNENGAKVVDGLETTASKLYGLQLNPPGGLGRTVAYDKQLRWMVTTEAVILKHHGVAYAVEAFCEIFAKSMEKDANSPRIPAIKARIRPAISKIVDSLHLHTVNMGHRIQPPPEILEALPKHYLAETWLADVVLAIGKADRDVIVELNCYIPVIVEWIFHHWSGRLKITLNNRIEYDQQLGELQNTAFVLIQNSCIATDDCHDADHIRNFKVSLQVGSGSDFEKRTAGITNPGLGARNESSYRSELYDIHNPFKTLVCYLNAKELKRAQRIAQDIVRFIVDLPVSPVREVVGLQVVKNSATRLRWWLKKTPGLLQTNLSSGESKSDIVLPNRERRLTQKKHSRGSQLRKGSRGDDENSMDFDTESNRSSDGEPLYTSTQIIHWYSDIKDGLKLAYERCECGCSRMRFEDCIEEELDTGCLMTLMYAEITLHIAHAMGEAGGAESVSNLQGLNTSIMLSEAAVQFLGVLADKHHILWDDWFRLVSSVITGISYDIAKGNTFDAGSLDLGFSLLVGGL